MADFPKTKSHGPSKRSSGNVNIDQKIERHGNQITIVTVGYAKGKRVRIRQTMSAKEFTDLMKGMK